MVRLLNLTPSTAHQIFRPRLFAKNAGVHVTWQILLSDSTQTGKCRQWLAEPANTKFHEHSFSDSPVAADPQYCTYTPAKCLLMCHKAAIVTNPVTPAEHKTGTRTCCSTNLRLELWHLLFCASGTSRPVHSSRLCCPRTHSEWENVFEAFPWQRWEAPLENASLLSAHCYYIVYIDR
jgi:hypothetical protein